MNNYYNQNLRTALEPPDLNYYCPGLVNDVLSQNLETGRQMREYCKDVACPKYCPSNYDCRDTCLEAPFTTPMSLENYDVTPGTQKKKNKNSYKSAYMLTFIFFIALIIVLFFILKK